MAKIIVNGKTEVEGKISVNREVDLSQNPPTFIVAGSFLTSQYFDEISSLECDKFKIEGIEVWKEAFGSEEDDILYEFVSGVDFENK